MDLKYLYPIELAVMAALSLAAVIFLLTTTKSNLINREKLPRAHKIGAVIAIIDFILLLPHLDPVLPLFLARYKYFLTAAAAVLAIGFLDYLFSRALAGLLILLSYLLIHSAFAYPQTVNIYLYIASYLCGITGILFAAKPSWMRDFIRLTAKHKKIRLPAVCYLAVQGIFTAVLAVYLFIKL